MDVLKDIPKKTYKPKLINPKLKIKKPQGKTIKYHISARKGSITSKNFEVFSTNITQLET